MSDILEEIQELQEKFKNLYRTKDGEVGLRFVDGTPQFKAVFQGPDVPKLHRLTDLERARKAQEYRMKHSEYDPEDGMVYHEPPEEEKKPIHNNKPEARLPKGDKKMNDNNSYNEIVSQILTLKEDFMNLIEVEGLGDPSNEVPPSTNKIKRDRKTKDGKVEVVSVEDELFPYDGNKREQYRQKVLDTINNMIQGTATLEDLLQIVRQKKAPLKEAMEVLENLGSYIQNKYGDSKEGKELYDKYFQNFNKEANDAITKERVEDIEKKDKKPLEYYVKKLLDKRNETKNSKGEFKTDSRREDFCCHSPLKEAMEVLGSIISEKHVFPKKAVEDGNKKYLEADKKNNEATRLARKGFEKLNKKIKELEGKGIDTDVDIEPGVTYGNGPKKEYQQALKTADALYNAHREADREETKARNNQRKLRAEGLKGVVMRQFDYVPTKKGDSFNVKKVLNKNEALEEALRVLEGLFVNDGRGDLIDNDVMSSPGWTRKTIENGIVKVAKGCQKKVDNKEK